LHSEKVMVEKRTDFDQLKKGDGKKAQKPHEKRTPRKKSRA